MTATKEAGFAKFGHGMRDFVACLLRIREIVTTQIIVIAAKANQQGERKISIERIIYILNLLAFRAEISPFLMYFRERKKGIRDPGLLKIRELSTPCRCGLSSL